MNSQVEYSINLFYTKHHTKYSNSGKNFSHWFRNKLLMNAQVLFLDFVQQSRETFSKEKQL